MSDPKLTPEVRDKWMDWWARVDANLGAELAEKLPDKMASGSKAFAPAKPGNPAPTGGLTS